MKKILFVFTMALMGIMDTEAQTSYPAALGIGIDLYDEATFIGPAGKYFFSEKHVGQAHFGIDEGATIVTALYSFHKEFVGARGLRWYAGVGPSMVFLDGSDNIFAMRPHGGLDFKIDGVPIVFNFDWRPSVVLSNVGENEVGAFGFGILFAFN